MKTRKKGVPLDDVLNEKLKNPIFAFHFKIGTAVLEFARVVRGLRKMAGLTQAELASRAKTTQAVIARIESGKDSRVPSSDLLFRIAFATNTRMRITFDEAA